jgi:hypothetical protein
MREFNAWWPTDLFLANKTCETQLLLTEHHWTPFVVEVADCIWYHLVHNSPLHSKMFCLHNGLSVRYHSNQILIMIGIYSWQKSLPIVCDKDDSCVSLFCCLCDYSLVGLHHFSPYVHVGGRDHFQLFLPPVRRVIPTQRRGAKPSIQAIRPAAYHRLVSTLSAGQRPCESSLCNF